MKKCLFEEQFFLCLIALVFILLFNSCTNMDDMKEPRKNTAQSNREVKYSYSEVSKTNGNTRIDYIQLDGDFDESNAIIKEYAYRYVDQNRSIMNEIDYMNISCEVTYFDNQLISLLFSCNLNHRTAPYPNYLLYTLTLRFSDCTVIQLNNQCTISDEFTALVRQKVIKQIQMQSDSTQMEKTITWFNETYNDNTLKRALETADKNKENGFFSFVSNDSLGICIPVLHVFGDYWIVEISHEEQEHTRA